MNLEQIHEAFKEVVNRRGIYNELGVPKNNVTQYRYKLRKGVHITIDKKISVLQRAGYRMDVFEFTDKDMIDLLRFALRNSEHARSMGPEYLFEKWKAQPAAGSRRLKY